MQPQVNPPDDEDLVIGFLDFTDRPAGQAVAFSRDVARLQRASEGPRQSASCSGDDVVERRRVRLEGPGSNFIVLGHRAMAPSCSASAGVRAEINIWGVTKTCGPTGSLKRC
jgi:hypothetical protein